jgi:hypothetical protein
MRRALAFVAVGLATAMMAAAPAVADPVNNPNTFPLALNCSGGLNVTVYPTGNAGHVAGSTTVGVLKGISSPGGEFIVPGFDLSELAACTSPAEPGVTFYVLVLPRGS